MSGNTYVCDILGYCDFQISFGIPSRLSRHKLLGSKQLACTRVAGRANKSELACADVTMQEVGVSAALSALHKSCDLRLRLDSQRVHFWNITLVTPSVYVPIPVMLALVLATGGEADFEYKCANLDPGLLRWV